MALRAVSTLLARRDAKTDRCPIGTASRHHAVGTTLRRVNIACPTCLLRPLVPADAPALARHANDRMVWQNLRDRFPHPYSEADAREYIAHASARPVQSSFGIVVDGEAIGNISLMLGDDIAKRSAEVGYWIGRAFWGRGIAVEALQATTHYAFAELGLARVFAVPFATTTRSARVLEKAGYVREGVMRRSAVKEGVLLDQLLYAAYDDQPPFNGPRPW
jgi:ribosomal-protein-alanine N-acetyltransferase